MHSEGNKPFVMTSSMRFLDTTVVLFCSVTEAYVQKLCKSGSGCVDCYYLDPHTSESHAFGTTTVIRSSEPVTAVVENHSPCISDNMYSLCTVDNSLCNFDNKTAHALVTKTVYDWKQRHPCRMALVTKHPCCDAALQQKSMRGTVGPTPACKAVHAVRSRLQR
jgi:hypothetical protein